MTWSSRGSISLEGLGLQVCCPSDPPPTQQQQHADHICSHKHTNCFEHKAAAAARVLYATTSCSCLLRADRLLLLLAAHCPAQVVSNPAEADFILAHGTEAIALPDGSTQDLSLEQLLDLTQQCADVAKQRGKELPMVVANPDLVRVTAAAWSCSHIASSWQH